MKRQILFVLCGVVFVVSLVSLGVLVRNEGDYRAAPIVYDDGLLFLRDETIAIAIVREETERIRGLSGQKSIGEREGLLLVFPETDFHGIWMRDMNFAIDIIWLDDDFRVVDVKEGASPESFRSVFDAEVFRPDTPARYVLEVRAGTARSIGISVGDIFRYEFAQSEQV